MPLFFTWMRHCQTMVYRLPDSRYNNTNRLRQKGERCRLCSAARYLKMR